MDNGQIKIAICDDNTQTCADIEHYLIEYADRREQRFCVDTYYAGKNLCEHLKNGQVYDLLFLDIELGDMGGVALGHFIRDELKDEVMQIVYISSHTKYALELFKVRPLDFMVKPVTEQMMQEILDTAIRLLGENNVTFSFKNGRDMNKVYIKNILYFKGKNREVEMVMVNGRRVFYDSLERIWSVLSKNRFFYVHKSFLINYFHVKEFFYDRVVMSDDEVIKIAQNRRKEVRELQMKYLMGGSGECR